MLFQFMQKIKGLILSFLFSKVDVFEATRRARICMGCSYNGELLAPPLVEKAIVAAHKEADFASFQGLKGCLLCGCFLNGKIWTHPKALKDVGIFKEQLQWGDPPKRCWQRFKIIQ